MLLGEWRGQFGAVVFWEREMGEGLQLKFGQGQREGSGPWEDYSGAPSSGLGVPSHTPPKGLLLSPSTCPTACFLYDPLMTQ